MTDSKEYKFVIRPWKRVVDLLFELATICIKDNCYRQDDSLRYFTEDEITIINNAQIKGESKIDGGHMFLDKPGGITGTIRLSSGDHELGWDFEGDNDGTIEIEDSAT